MERWVVSTLLKWAPPSGWISSLRESLIFGISFPSFVEKGWRISDQQAAGWEPLPLICPPPFARSLVSGDLRLGFYSLETGFSQFRLPSPTSGVLLPGNGVCPVSSLCSIRLRLPFFHILLAVPTDNEASGRLWYEFPVRSHLGWAARWSPCLGAKNARPCSSEWGWPRALLYCPHRDCPGGGFFGS